MTPKKYSFEIKNAVTLTGVRNIKIDFGEEKKKAKGTKKCVTKTLKTQRI